MASHDVQLSAALHVLQLESHARQAGLSPDRGSTNWPSGHVNVQVPAPLSKVAPARQEEQLVAPPPLHSAHDEWQTWQRPSASLYLPLGQSETDAPSS